MGQDKQILRDGSKLISNYYWITKNWANKYLNIFNGPTNGQTKIQIHLDRGKATNTNTNNICEPFYLNI